MRAALAGRVADYFLSRLPVGYRTRVTPDFADGVAFLDVETTGLGWRDDLTVVGVRLGGRTMNFVRGRDLHRFIELWRRIEVLVTFNGTRFDLPVLSRTFGLQCLPPHIDLMHEGRSYGYTGGLKTIENILGINRTPEEEGDGALAVSLWRRYVDENDATSLERLVRYNAKDVDSLVILANAVLRRSLDGHPGPLPTLPRL
jgi:uncharacterized protein YprB with RNaseH-like and TPR domain